MKKYGIGNVDIEKYRKLFNKKEGYVSVYWRTTPSFKKIFKRLTRLMKNHKMVLRLKSL
jgi:hypothetical protein